MEVDAPTSRGRRNPGPASPRNGGAPRPLRENARRAPLVGLVRALPERASERRQFRGGGRHRRPLLRRSEETLTILRDFLNMVEVVRTVSHPRIEENAAAASARGAA